MGLFGLFKRKPKVEYEFINCHIDRSGYEDAIDHIPMHINNTYQLNKKDFINQASEDLPEYEYDFHCSNPQLVQEKDSNGKNSIKAIMNDETVGFIKKGSISRINNLMNQNKIVEISATITGGKYKKYYTYYSDLKHKDITEIETGKESYGIIFTLKVLLESKE